MRKSYFWGLLYILFYCVLFTVFFCPVLFSGRLLAPGDGITYYLPNFYSKRTLWEPLLLSGFPVAADPQTMTWYPLSLIFSLFCSWNWFVIAAYVLAGCFSSGYIYTCTQSKIASLVGGITYSMSGFMMAHLGHTSIIHSAAWPPLLLWALENTRLRRDLRWAALGVVAVGCGILAGHPQFFVYSLGVSLAYVFLLGWNAPIGRWRYYSAAFMIFVFGFCLAAVLLLPAMQLASLSLRAQMSFGEFISYSLPLRQLPELLFPHLWGGSQESFYSVAYFGDWNLTELAGYVGLLPLFLAAICVWKNWRNPLVVFWLGVSVFSLLLTLGNTPLAHLVYHLPVYNKFQACARHFFEFTLALSILAGYGVATIERLGALKRVVVTTLITGFVTMLVTLIVTPLLVDFSNFLTKVGLSFEKFFSPTNPALWMPLVIGLMTSLILYYWSQQANSPLRKALLLLALIIDLGSFGWFREWRFYAPSLEDIVPPASAMKYKDILYLTSQRILPVQGGLASRMEIQPSLSRLWEIPSASGYGPLLLSRVHQLLSIAPWGGLSTSSSSLSQSDHGLNIMAVRYILLPRQKVSPPTFSNSATPGWGWAGEDMEISLGAECGAPLPKNKEIHFLQPVPASSIGIVSALACSVGISTGKKVADIEIKDEYGRSQTYPVAAGYDTAEWAYDCPDVLPVMTHSKATVFNSFSVHGKACEGHRYVATLPLNEATRISEINLRWDNRSGGITVSKISLFDGRSQTTYPVSLMASALADKARWSHVEDIEETSIYENLRVMPRAWLVPEVISTTPEQVLQTLRTSRFPDGREFDPSRVAFVEEPVQFLAPQADQKATAQVVHLSNTSVEIHTSSETPAFLVSSDVYYPGWQATIDGTLTHIFQTNYVLRGVMVPAGGHVIKFDFRPTSFYAGTAISVLSLLVVVVLFYRGGKSDS